MKIEFIKSHLLHRRRRMVIGAKAVVWDSLGHELIRLGVAKSYEGNLNTKTKTDFFKRKG